MATKKTQEELEQTVKGYQLEAVEVKVDDVLGKLDKVLNQTSGLVTQTQLKALETTLKDYVKEEIKKVHLIYKPFKTKITWLNGLIGGAIVAQVIYIAFNLLGGK